MSNLLELLTLLQPATDDDLSADTLLKRTLLALMQSLPDAKSIRILRDARDGVILWGATESETLSKVMRYQDYPQYKAVIDHKQVIQDDAGARLLIPLITGNDAYAILEITFKADLPDENDVAWLISFAYQFGISLDQRRLNQLITIQTNALSRLGDAETFPEIASILASVILHQGQFITINLFQKDDLGNLVDIKTVFTANRHKTLETDEAYQYDKPYLKTIFTIIQAGDYLITDVATDPALNETFRQWLISFKIRSVYNLPLRDTSNQVYGFVGINDTLQTIAISEAESQIYRNLVKQASFTIQNHNLIQQVIDEAEEARILYQMIRELIVADGVTGIIHVVRQHLGRVADRIQFMEIEYDEDQQIRDMIISHQLSAGTDEVVSMPRSIMAITTAESRQDLLEYWQRIGSEVEVYEDISQPDANIPLKEALKAQGIHSSVTFPIYTDGKRIAQLSLAWHELQTFTDNYRRLAQALNSEITLIIQNQRFLQQIQKTARASIEQVELLANLNSIASASNTASNELDFLEKIVDTLLATVQVDHVGVTLVQENGEKATVVAESPQSNAVGQEVDITGSVFAKMREDQQNIVIHDVASSTILTDDTKAVLKMVSVKHLMIVPFFNIENELIGTIGLDLYDEEARFTESIQSIASTVSSQIATSLQKLRLLEDTRRQVEQIQLVSKFGQTVQATLRDDQILELALQYTLQVIHADYLAMIKLENNKFWRMPYFENGHNNPSTPADTLEPSRIALLRATLEKSETLVIQDRDHHVPVIDYPLLETYRSLILLPVIAQGQQLGVVEIASKKAYTYHISDIASLEQMTSQFGSALMNANAFAKSQRTAQNRASANNISIQLQQQADVNSMLNVTVMELGRLLNAKQGRIRLGINKTNET